MGVGAAAWAAPDITSMGGTPAYAASCTAGSTLFSLCTNNSSCSCTSDAGFTANGVAYAAGQDTISYKPCDPANNGSRCPGPTFPGNLSFNFGNSGACAVGSSANGNGTAGTAAVVVTPTDSTLFCKAVVRVYDGSACTTNYNEYSGPVPSSPGAASLLLPQIPCASGGGGGNKFISYLVECSTERECL